jgi:hypothetical protein
LHRHPLPYRGSDPTPGPRGHELRAFGPTRTGCLPLTRRPLYLVSYEGIVASVRFERTLSSASCWCLLPIGLRRHRSRRPVTIRTARLTRAGPQPCAAASLPGLGSNQRRQGSGPCWGRQRPTRNRYGRRDSNSQAAGFEPARYSGFPSRPRGAPPGTRTPYRRIKSPVLHPYSSRRADPYAASRRPDEFSGPPRIRTGKPSPCKGVALPVGASSPGAARSGATGSQGRPRGRGCAHD